MTTISTPKTLSDLRYQDNVIYGAAGPVIDEAKWWFREFFQNTAHVYLRLLFVEDGHQVWEAYQDAGSVDYLYLVK